MNVARALIQYVRFHAGCDEHLPGFITQQGIDIGLEAEASGGIIFFASDGRPTEKKVIVGFPRASGGLGHSIADAQIDWLVPAAIAGTKNTGHFDDAPKLHPPTPAGAKSFAISGKLVILRGKAVRSYGNNREDGHPRQCRDWCAQSRRLVR
ncbi:MULTISPECIES: hypothetical protein [unclassified Rhizobium]|uniref:hypothetical protein n=1 Tax=unclassified Rhizobium TaxID=2613769 RepID=UPI00185DEA99|nr:MULTISPECIES: hypothetical protein [unclassified Rhizobium]MBB3613060.1 hypothetical protein [Rhizobium sp. BK609]MBB3678718.1 hypothetical protein [Rhizobium sp. BK612]